MRLLGMLRRGSGRKFPVLSYNCAVSERERLHPVPRGAHYPAERARVITKEREPDFVRGGGAQLPRTEMLIRAQCA